MIFYTDIKAAFQHQPVLEATESQRNTGSSIEVLLTSGYHFNHGGCCTVRSSGVRRRRLVQWARKQCVILWSGRSCAKGVDAITAGKCNERETRVKKKKKKIKYTIDSLGIERPDGVRTFLPLRTRWRCLSCPSRPWPQASLPASAPNPASSDVTGRMLRRGGDGWLNSALFELCHSKKWPMGSLHV